MEEFITRSEAVDFRLIAAEEPEELHDEDYDVVGDFEAKYRDALVNPDSVNRRGLEIKKAQIAKILGVAGRPIFYVKGNHYVANWGDAGNMTNVEGKSIRHRGYSFIGIKDVFKGIRSTFEYSSETAKLITEHSMIVSHSPPYGILDKTDAKEEGEKRARLKSIGSKPLRRLTRQTKPLYWFFGHVHEGFGIVGNMINCSWHLAKKFVSIDLETREVRFLDGMAITGRQ
jgi:Icc-related predicted phosphoesterase